MAPTDTSLPKSSTPYHLPSFFSSTARKYVTLGHVVPPESPQGPAHKSSCTTLDSCFRLNPVSLDLNGDHCDENPPTANELDPQEKARMIKKARKLSHVFGEMPSAEVFTSAECRRMSHLSRSSIDVTSKFHISAIFDRRPSQPDIRTVTPLATTMTMKPGSHKPSLAMGYQLRFLDSVGLRSPIRNEMVESPPKRKSSPPPQSSGPKEETMETKQSLGNADLFPSGNGSSIGGKSSRRESRRKSLDVEIALGTRNVDAEDDVFPASHLKRAQSLWSNGPGRRSMDSDVSGKDFQRRYYSNFWGNRGDVDERQRIVNVRRARKVAQIFGQDPPSELIIGKERTSFSKENETISEHGTSVFSRSRAPSVRSSISEIQEQELQEEQEDVHNIIDGHTMADAVSVHSVSSASPSLDAFHQRQRRAAKLSRFFGVDYHNIQTSIPVPDTPQPPPPPPTETPAQSSIDNPPASPPTKEVDIKIGRRSFWGFGYGQDQLKDAEMADILEQLRSLK